MLAATAIASPVQAVNVQSSAAAESCHTWIGPHTFYTASGYIGAAGWIMFFDATAPPADGAVTPFAWINLSAAGSWSLAYQYPSPPVNVTNGLVICASSTGPLTKTAYSTNTVFSAMIA